MEQSIPFQVPSKMTAVRVRTAGSEKDPKAGPLAPSTNPFTDRTGPDDPKRAIIFLDIDGVLNRSHRKARSNSHVVATDLLARLKSLVSSTDAFVVLASTWRHEPNGLQKARELGIPFEDVLPDLRPCSRGREVKAWLANHPHSKRFAIIDDDDDEYEDMPLFQPNPSQGLSEQVAAAIEEYLAGRRKDDYRRSLLIRAFEYLKSYFEGHRG
jgi:HAD domain in Swiss Army Knife RNA repair proteins